MYFNYTPNSQPTLCSSPRLPDTVACHFLFPPSPETTSFYGVVVNVSCESVGSGRLVLSRRAFPSRCWSMRCRHYCRQQLIYMREMGKYFNFSFISVTKLSPAFHSNSTCCIYYSFPPHASQPLYFYFPGKNVLSFRHYL